MNERPHIVVVDNNAAMRDFLHACLTARGYHTEAIDNAEEAIARCRVVRPAAVILNLATTGRIDSLDAISALKAIEPDLRVIVLSDQARTPAIVQAMKRGASDFISTPFDETDLDLALAKALKQREAAPAIPGRRRVEEAPPPVLLGRSPLMAEVRDFIQRAASTDVPVLIRGESGTGKTLVAREIVAASARWDKPFITVNCSARPTDAIEAEMFGVEPGAFSDAESTPRTPFESARHGTLFLDEIGEMSAALQARLLQILQDGDARLGSRHEVHADVRIIATTSRDLGRAVAEGQLREDLFFRLNVVSLHLPPLRERREDIPILTRHFLERYSAQYGTPLNEISPPMMRRFMEYDWPGNVRELDNLIRRAVLLGTEASLASALSPPRSTVPSAGFGTPAAPPDPSYRRDLRPAESGASSLKDRARTAAREAERTLILETLEQTHWNRKEAAALLGISYKALLNKIKDSDLHRG